MQRREASGVAGVLSFAGQACSSDIPACVLLECCAGSNVSSGGDAQDLGMSLGFGRLVFRVLPCWWHQGILLFPSMYQRFTKFLAHSLIYSGGCIRPTAMYRFLFQNLENQKKICGGDRGDKVARGEHGEAGRDQIMCWVVWGLRRFSTDGPSRLHPILCLLPYPWEGAVHPVSWLNRHLIRQCKATFQFWLFSTLHVIFWCPLPSHCFRAGQKQNPLPWHRGQRLFLGSSTLLRVTFFALFSWPMGKHDIIAVNASYIHP